MNSKTLVKLILIVLVLFTLLAMPAMGQFDNCCFVGRECATAEDFHKGYVDYQDGQCLASPAATQPAAATIDNICFTYWAGLCTTDDDFTAGWYVYKHGCDWTWINRPLLRNQLTNKGDRSCYQPANETAGASVSENTADRERLFPSGGSSNSQEPFLRYVNNVPNWRDRLQTTPTPPPDNSCPAGLTYECDWRTMAGPVWRDGILTHEVITINNCGCR